MPNILNNRISTRRLESKQHREVLKAKQPPLSHACSTPVQKMSDESPLAQAERWAKAPTESLIALRLFTQPRDGDGTNSSFPLKLDQTWGWGGLLHVMEEEQAEFSRERDSRSKPGTRSRAQAGSSSWLSLRSIRPATVRILSTDSPEVRDAQRCRYEARRESVNSKQTAKATEAKTTE